MNKLALSLCSIISISIGFGAIAQALPSQEVETIYYSDSQKTDEVGGAILLCSGGRSTWGQVTRYSTRRSSPCNGGGPKPPSTSGNSPCEFLRSGCSPIPSRNDGHYIQ
ncbi:MAG: DUF6289 family protein [Thermosynechococcaceae cyanobacterium]